MNRILPFIALSKPLRGADDAHQFDADVFAAHPSLVGFVRPMIELEFADAPQALRRALDTPLMDPFRVVVMVSRADAGGLFPHRRAVRQVRTSEGFDPLIDGVLRAGFLSNNATDRQPEPMSKGAASRLLYDVRQ